MMGKLNRRKLCECNTCGLYVKLGRRFIKGHNTSWNKGLSKETDNRLLQVSQKVSRTLTGRVSSRKGTGKPKSPPQLCACNECGLMTNPGCKYIKGHNKGMLGKHLPEEQKSVQSVVQKIAQIRSDVREKRKISRQITDAKPEVKKKRSDATRKCWLDQERRKRQSEMVRIEQNKPERKKQNSERAKIVLSKPEVREKAKEGQEKYRQNHKEEISERNKRPEARSKISNSVKKFYLYHPETGDEHARMMREKWQDPIYVQKQMKARNVRQNKTEKQLEDTINKILPNEYKFVGHGEVVIGGKCPDFININGQKKIIELYGDYWHDGQNPQDRINIFKEYGYDTLVIWEHELKDIDKLKVKLNEFHIKINPYSIHMEK